MAIDLSREYLYCRTFGHAWDDFTPLYKRNTFGVALAVRCTRCFTERHDIIGVTGAVIQRQYIYPEGYSLQERVTRNEFRRELLRRRRRRSNLKHA